jgi:hypothetical protein
VKRRVASEMKTVAAVGRSMARIQRVMGLLGAGGRV